MTDAKPRVLRVSLRTATVLLLFTLAFTALMAITYSATRPRLEASAQAEKLRLINEILPAAAYDNDLLADFVTLPATPALGVEDVSTLYRARRGGAPVALIIEAQAADGYAGRINLVMALSPDGRLIALRVAAHKETPGLGDYIDPKKDKNKTQPWVGQFNDLGFDIALGGKWKVKKDGGIIEARTGATISARAVANASGRAVAWAYERQEKLFALPAGSQWKEIAP